MATYSLNSMIFSSTCTVVGDKLNAFISCTCTYCTGVLFLNSILTFGADVEAFNFGVGGVAV